MSKKTQMSFKEARRSGGTPSYKAAPYRLSGWTCNDSPTAGERCYLFRKLIVVLTSQNLIVKRNFGLNIFFFYNQNILTLPMRWNLLYFPEGIVSMWWGRWVTEGVQLSVEGGICLSKSGKDLNSVNIAPYSDGLASILKRNVYWKPRVLRTFAGKLHYQYFLSLPDSLHRKRVSGRKNSLHPSRFFQVV